MKKKKKKKVLINCKKIIAAKKGRCFSNSLDENWTLRSRAEKSEILVVLDIVKYI